MDSLTPKGMNLMNRQKVIDIALAEVGYLVRKAAIADVDKKLSDFEDYTKNYSHMSWDEYQKTKGGKK